jgi:tetratricopeptide (TPR) repeat protein
MSKLSSTGFDLDAMPNTGNGTEDVIYEVGCKATVALDEPVAGETKAEEMFSPLDQSEVFKARGNDEFRSKNYLEAYDMYTAAIEACPGIAGKKLLELRDEFDAQERNRLQELHRLDTVAKARNNAGEGAENQAEEREHPKPRVFEAPPHPYGNELSIYHCNRAACSLHLTHFDDAIADCDIAVLLRPTWAKAYIRRSVAHESLEDQTDKALADAKTALELDPSNASIRKSVQRLQKIEDERLQKLKDETLGKLKDLGNSILGNFGLSLDNFSANQDPNTGSYSISFNQEVKK